MGPLDEETAVGSSPDPGALLGSFSRRAPGARGAPWLVFLSLLGMYQAMQCILSE